MNLLPRHAVAAVALLIVAGCSSGGVDGTGVGAPPEVPVAAVACAPDSDTAVFEGSVQPQDAKQYLLIPFDVEPGTGRVEVAYRWDERLGLPGTPLTETTLDLGLYDQRGAREGFRGWGGSRQGRLDRDQAAVFVESDRADRGFMPGPIEAGVWWVELGVAAVSLQGADWRVEVRCHESASTRPADVDPVDRSHIARGESGWYHGDLHMHAFHSQPHGPDWEDFIAQSRAASLDFLMVTEYITGRHWETLGAVARAHPDLLIVPGREIITYHGHANTHGETPGLFEYRHGFEDVHLADVQREARALGALFQVSHPTIFPPPLFENFCRGCYFELGDEIDWDAVDTIEVLTGPIMAGTGDLGLPLALPVEIENPFVRTAIELWEELLSRGHRITAVSGSDSKGIEHPDDRARSGYGSSVTAVHVEKLQRDALFDSLRAGRAYIRTRGVAGSPELRMVASDGDNEVMFGGTLHADTAELRVEVRGGVGQRLRYFANGRRVTAVTVDSDPFVHVTAIGQRPGAGPLGTFWRVETHDGRARTTIGNPVFLKP